MPLTQSNRQKMAATAQRAQEMLARYKGGEPVRKIALNYALSQGRVRQLIQEARNPKPLPQELPHVDVRGLLDAFNRAPRAI